MTAASPYRVEALRKAIHLGTAAVPIAWGLGWVGTNTVRGTLGLACLLAVAVEAARHRQPAFAAWFEARVGALLRPHEHAHAAGATWLALAMWLVAMLAPERAAVAALWAAAVGDASAALVGKGLAAPRRRSVGGAGKSLVGSIACVVATAPGVVWLAQGSWAVAFALGVVAAAAERPRLRIDDNLRVALVTAVAAVLLGLR